MTTKNVTTKDNVESLLNSPIHNIRPVDENPVWIDIGKIEIDLTNPGGMTVSKRYVRRTPSMRDSYDVLGRIVYPIIVCRHPDDPTRFIHVDGFGRLEQLKERGEKRIKAIVYPSLTLEQRICLRQTLNAAQEPFDVASIIHDLQLLAKERGLDVRNSDHVRTLVRDLPEGVSKHAKDLITLARWDSDAAGKLGESYRLTGEAIGIDKIRGLTRILDVVSERHAEVVKAMGGEMALSSKLAKMYLDSKFSVGTRSQEAIRKVQRALGALPENHSSVARFFDEELDWQILEPYAFREREPKNIADACKQLIRLVLDVDVSSLSDAERRALERTHAVLQGLLS